MTIKNENSNRRNLSKVPLPHEKVEVILELYKAGRLQAAKELSISLTKKFPSHKFGWKILAAILHQKNKINESLIPIKKLVELSPKDAQAHCNLGVTLQKLGKLKEAEDSYAQAILLKPNFAEAYNNLGNILQENGRLEEAETNFKQAILIAPKYVEAYFNIGNTLKKLRKLEEAKDCYTQAIALKPDFAEAYNNLGIVFQDLGKLEEAVASITKATELKSDFAEAYNNLGNTQKKLGRLDSAEITFKRAIKIMPNYVEAHSNLGMVLQELGKLDQAEESYIKSINLNFNSPEVYNNLGNTQNKLGKLEKAESSYVRAVTLKPDFFEARNNLGITLQELGRLDEAEASYIHAIKLKPDYASAIHNLSIVQHFMSKQKAEIISLNNLLQIDANYYGLIAGVNLALCYFLRGEFENSKSLLLGAKKIMEKTSSKFKNEKAYWLYLTALLSHHEENRYGNDNKKIGKFLHVIGDSHSLVSHQMIVQILDSNIQCKTDLIIGCKQWHLGNPYKNKYKNKFESIFNSLPKSSEVLLTLGEIDCRIDGGILRHKKKFPEKKLQEIIVDTVENYLAYVAKINFSCKHKIIIQGVPCPNISKGTCSNKNEVMQLINVIKKFNNALEDNSKRKGFDFLDVHRLTDRGDGFSNAKWHIDEFHLSPEGFLEAWRRK